MDHLTWTFDPTWPWSLSWIGLPALVVVAVAIAVLTVWTYLGVSGATVRRVLVVLGLRLAALVLALLAVLRPALAVRDDLRVPSLLLVAADDSESMTIQDEFDGQSRWEQLRRMLRRSESALERLRDERNVNVVLVRFAADVHDFDPAASLQAEGKRSDYGMMLHTLFERYRGERYLRGLVVLGDGTDNGTRHPALPLAAQWRSLPCPIHTFALGKPTTSDRQTDIALTHITTEPSPVPIKGKLTVRVTADAPGFENRTVRVRVLIDGQEVPVLVRDKEEAFQEESLRLTSGNDIKVVCNAPPRPGEYKVTLRLEPQRDELATFNNEISTFVTVTKEGISVLLVDKARHPEPVLISRVLASDPRLRLYDVTFRSARETPQPGVDLFRFSERPYDVIIIGDVTPGQMAAGGPNAFATIKDLVKSKGTGLLFMGGYSAFGPAWRAVPEMAELMPAQLDAAGQIEERVKLALTDRGKAHFVMRLLDDPVANEAAWRTLTLEGMSRLGRVKPDIAGEVLLAAESGEPVLVARLYDKGRVMAFAGDTTWRWVRPPQGHQLHARFWKQLVLWLAKQEEAEGNVWVKPDTRRLPSGGRLGFAVGLRGKGGVDLKEARYEARIVGPDGVETAVPTTRDRDEDRGAFWKTDVPGEYRIVVKGSGKDTDGQMLTGETSARFLVSQDDTELARRAADHEFLKRLAAAGGGKFHRGDEDALARFLQTLYAQPLPQVRPKATLWPDWRRLTLSGFLPGFFLAFVTLLSLEWLLRRRWGLV